MEARMLAPELLDELPACDPRAIRSRQDLIRVNGWMFSARLMARVVREQAKTPVSRMLDIGSGDGLFTLAVAKLLAPTMPGVSVTLVDRRDVVSAQTCERFEQLGWRVDRVECDVFRFLKGAGTYDLVTTNLFLHHFEGSALLELLRLVSLKTQLVAACEPARTPFALAGSRMLWAIGCNEITRYDAIVSVRAGFKNREISAQWPTPASWELNESAGGLFSHTFTARRLP
jgi:hypothetical protein